MKRIVLVAVLLGAVALGTSLFMRHPASSRLWRADDARPTSAPPAARATVATVDRPVAANAAKAPAGAPRLELPPQDVPLASILPALVRAARAGDSAAMCRLSFELYRCGVMRDFRRIHHEDISDQVLYSDRPPPDYSLKEYDVSRESLAEADRICADVVPPADLKPWRLLRDAARAGHVPSMVRFTTQFPNEPNGSLYDMDALVARRDESIGFLRRAAEAGDARAAFLLFWGFSGNSGFPTPFQEDPKHALAYALTLRGVGDQRIQQNVRREEARLRRKLPATDVLEAERLAASLAPRFAHLAGVAINPWEPGESAEDCEQLDPRLRPVPAESNQARR